MSKIAGTFPILVIDDEIQVVDILRRCAETVFPEAVFTAITGYGEAVAHLDQLTGLAPKLIMLDIDLHAGLDGLDLLSSLRQHPKGRLLPVIVLSSHVHKCRQAYNLGASSFFGKPYRYHEWKEMVGLIRQYWYTCVSIPDLWLPDGIEL